MFKSQRGEGVGKLTSFRRDWVTCYVLVETRRASLFGMDLQRGSCPSCSRAWHALRGCLFLTLLPHGGPMAYAALHLYLPVPTTETHLPALQALARILSDLDGVRDFVWRPFGERERGGEKERREMSVSLWWEGKRKVRRKALRCFLSTALEDQSPS